MMPPRFWKLIVPAIACLPFGGCGPLDDGKVEVLQIEELETVNTDVSRAEDDDGTPQAEDRGLATFGAGCFWCVEAVFEELDGVIDVKSGYAGGSVDHPTYQQVCSGATGHAEVCQITYDPQRITYKELLEVFWKTHDPTTLNRQGADIGTQYRSVIFYHDEQQKELAEKYKAQLDASGAWPHPIVTEVSPLPYFYDAEAYHQDYYRQNPGEGYCQFVIRPKMDKFRAAFQEKLKSDAGTGAGEQ